ncbi:hypothetical protein CERSUDRAFT_100841 [Gelatoporia subvermispora B]|uniref:Uncharacterized protein n=1 Tax=Ceriporiopsis subvermispora (strain B) TaxID=914234 RepID=M2QWQ5_CERS8|nr:hypothetical protein CERSUDRAFT_100841 [Gelatoporia subvermispora B]
MMLASRWKRQSSSRRQSAPAGISAAQVTSELDLISVQREGAPQSNPYDMSFPDQCKKVDRFKIQTSTENRQTDEGRTRGTTGWNDW